MALAIILALFGFEDGSLIFVENSNEIVEMFSTTTHVAIVFDGFAYQAEPPKVRKVLLSKYLAEISLMNKSRKKAVVYFYKPKFKLSQDQKSRMRETLESQVNKRYSVKGYFTKEQSDGIHCAELSSIALRSAGLVRCERPWCVSPSDLRYSVSKIYSASAGYYLLPKEGFDWDKWVAEMVLDTGKWCSWSLREIWSCVD